MKKLLLFLFSAFAFAACEQAPIEEQSAIRYEAPDTITVGFEGDDTRIQLNEAQKTVWTEGDHVSVFYRSTVNEEWQFMGETGDRTGQIVPVDNSVNPPATHNRVVVIYPYNNEYYLNTETYSIEASLPAVQTYLKDSYGTNGNIMVSSNDYKQVSLKSVCGWLKLQLTGDGEVVKSITLRGNNGEQVAGELHINTSDATCVLALAMGDAGDSEVGGTLVRPGTILTEVTLDCGDGVALGKEATAFYIALPPQTFEKGFTVELEDTEGYVMEQSTDKTLTIERNTIKPMAAFEFINPNSPAQPTPANNWIWYTSSDGNVVEPYYTNVFGANITSNTYNNGMGIITFDGDVTKIENYAFNDCTRLTSVNIPDSVTTIGYSAFQYCHSLTSVYCKATTPPALYGYYVFDNNGSGRKIYVPAESVEAYKSAYSWSEYADAIVGYDFENGVVVEIPANEIWYTATEKVVPYNSNAFNASIESHGWDSATGKGIITFNDEVTIIGDRAFYECASLTSITLPNSLTQLGSDALRGCTNITSITFPESLSSIGDYAMEKCSKLSSLYFKGATPPSVGNFTLTNVSSDIKIYVPAGAVEAYKSVANWSWYGFPFIGYDFETGEVVE